MGDLNLTQMQAEVLLALKNLRSSHPAVAAGLHTRAINHAANRLIRMVIGGNAKNVDLFPEHTNNTWTIGPTIVGDNSISMPDNCIAMWALRHSKDTTISSGNWSSVAESVVSPSKVQTIGLLTKSATTTGYPTLWARKANVILYYPATRSGYTTYLRVYGVAGEDALSSGGETFRLHRDWDAAVVLLAAEELARKIGWSERADELLADVRGRIQETVNVTSLGETPSTAEAESMPNRVDVYGGIQ